MNTVERLQGYYPHFNIDNLLHISKAAFAQNGMEFNQLTSMYGVEDGPQIIKPHGAYKPFEALTFRPRRDYDETVMRVYHLPMANRIGPNMVMRGIRLFAADQSEPLMLVGNAAEPGHGAGKQSLKEIWQMSHDKTLAPTVEGLTLHLHDLGITSVSHLGYSYGADKAAEAISTSAEYHQTVKYGVLVEPASIAAQGVLALAKKFQASGNKLQDYIDQTDSVPYQAIRAKENNRTLALYAAGLLRLSNLAIAKVLATDGFSQRVENGVEKQPKAQLTIGWGSASELTDDDTMQRIYSMLRTDYPDRIRKLRLMGMHHAGSEDIDLHAAIMLEGLTER
jgi:hypothetical protein